MAATKKPATEKKATAAVKVEETKAATKKAVEVKAEPVKETVEKVEEVKMEESAKKAPAKKAAPAKKTTAKKAEVNTVMQIQFSGKSYSQEDLMQIAKDVWTYDLNQNAEDLTSVELYVKPEENKVYYVMNGIAGYFEI